MPKRSHGMTRPKAAKIYRIWANIKQRCNNPNNPAYHNYGGRGIKICDEWASSFEAFFSSVGHPPTSSSSLDRRNNNGDYEPGNVRWADSYTQAQNSRKATHVTISGVTKTISEWCRDNGIPYVTCKTRRRRDGWSLERAVTEPPNKLKRRKDHVSRR